MTTWGKLHHTLMTIIGTIVLIKHVKTMKVKDLVWGMAHLTLPLVVSNSK
jgi:hypothetical protein